MILILGHFPDEKNERDGMVQRIAAIDGIIASHDRIYISTHSMQKPRTLGFYLRNPLKWIKAVRKGHIRQYGNVMVYRRIDERSLLALMDKASVVYVHSLYFLAAIPRAALSRHGSKMILDLHGCVVEESHFLGQNDNLIKVLEDLEKMAFSEIKFMVSVSQKMIDFYKEKYGKNNVFIKLPIFSDVFSPICTKNSNEKPVIIYSGGTQKWQNVDLMIEIAKKTHDRFSYIFLVTDKKEFSDRFGDDIPDEILIDSVPKSDVCKYYRNADFGFILREKNIVNTVSCPTKMVEYMQNGLIPVVLQPEIGDFFDLDYSYVTSDDLMMGNMPSSEDIQMMKLKNHGVIQEMDRQNMEGVTALLGLLDRLDI